jgi:CDP-diacylglycerol--glycerol-3-phosphate 3-phosphatidyltransferase
MSTSIPERQAQSIPSTLRADALRLAGAELVMLGIAYAGLRSVWGPIEAARWLAPATLVLGYQWTYLRSRLRLNRHPTAIRIRPRLGAANLLSAGRGACLALMAGFLFLPRPTGPLAWAPALLYTTGIAVDFLDGTIARRRAEHTLLGESLDLELDGQGVLLAALLAVWYDTLPWWFLAAGAARYAFALNLWLRRRRGKPVFELPESAARRPLAGLMMGFLSVVLWPIFSPPATHLAGAVFFVPFGAGFLRDGLVVSGVIRPHHAWYRRARRLLRTVFLRWLPTPLRAILVWLTALRATDKIAASSVQVDWYGRLGFPSPQLVVPAFAVLEVIGLTMVALGAAGRLGAVVLLIPLGLTIAGAGLDTNRGVSLVSTLCILILGTGFASLARPEERWLGRRAGAVDGHEMHDR